MKRASKLGLWFGIAGVSSFICDYLGALWIVLGPLSALVFIFFTTPEEEETE